MKKEKNKVLLTKKANLKVQLKNQKKHNRHNQEIQIRKPDYLSQIRNFQKAH